MSVTSPPNAISPIFNFFKQNLASFAKVRASTMDPKLRDLLQELHSLPQAPCMLFSSVAWGMGGPAHQLQSLHVRHTTCAVTFMYDLSELKKNADYPDYSGKLFLMGIKRGKRGVGGGKGPFFHPIGHSLINSNRTFFSLPNLPRD